MQIIVLGMHRAGTSVIARLINMMGAYIGAPHTLLPADKDNPKGFWERRDVLQCNRELMRLSGCVWFMTSRWRDNLVIPPPLSQRMQAIVDELDTHAPWVMKDPRLCLTLPYWLSHLKHPVIVTAYRDPLAIAQSLHKRNGMPPEYALALWEYHAVHAIRDTHALPRIIVDHNAVMQHPVEETGKLFAALTEHGIRDLSLPDEARIRAFIDPKPVTPDAAAELDAHQQTLAAMLRGDTPPDAHIQVSDKTQHTMETLAPKVSGAPV